MPSEDVIPVLGSSQKSNMLIFQGHQEVDTRLDTTEHEENKAFILNLLYS